MPGISVWNERLPPCHPIWMAATLGGRFGKVMSVQRSILTESPFTS